LANLRSSVLKLEEVREEWEKGLIVKSVIEQPAEFRVLVILIDDRGLYHLHRYFKIGPLSFVCSVDAQKTGLETVWEWLEKPQAIGVVC